MDGNHPKRRKDKYNPYSISEKNGHYFLSFKDGQGVAHHFEIDKPLFELFDRFELDDLSYLNVVDRHIEQSDLTDASLNSRAFYRAASVEDTVIHNERQKLLNKLIAELPEKQRRRLYLYYFAGLTYERIAEMGGCTSRAVEYSVEVARNNLRKKL